MELPGLEVQDLGSRNGTFVAGRCIAAGERVALAPGELLGFGRPDGFRFVQAAPPVPFAIPVAGGVSIEASGGLLALPDASSPELTVYRSRDHGWVVEQDGQLSAVSDGAPVQTRAGTWRLCLPESLPATEEALDAQPTIDTVTLRFRVSSDEETVELLALHGRTVIDLKVRAHHYPLLLLARARLRDADKPIERQGGCSRANSAGNCAVNPTASTSISSACGASSPTPGWPMRGRWSSDVPAPGSSVLGSRVLMSVRSIERFVAPQGFASDGRFLDRRPLKVLLVKADADDGPALADRRARRPRSMSRRSRRVVLPQPV
ncbi:hypothetical protein [Nannocystis pusilla]|uniref:hypothetical protein n=1 Tax=Nannocystis pusilla TaxID=889268 RepID=UPI003B7C9740